MATFKTIFSEGIKESCIRAYKAGVKCPCYNCCNIRLEDELYWENERKEAREKLEREKEKINKLTP